MPIETIEHQGRRYPKLQASGFAARFAFSFAKELCTGIGYDIGCNREEWKLPGAIGIDPDYQTVHKIPGGGIKIFGYYSATQLPDMKVDYIFSSHCLEHIPDWVGVLEYWKTKIQYGGVLFLYLPHPKQTYWRPWWNRKHVNLIHPKDIRQYLKDSVGWCNVFVTGRDLNHSYYAIAERV